MRRRVTVVLAVLISGGALAAIAPLASASTSQAKVPPACVQHKLPAHLNLQVGYCP
jgi:hypothetical protein